MKRLALIVGGVALVGVGFFGAIVWRQLRATSASNLTNVDADGSFTASSAGTADSRHVNRAAIETADDPSTGGPADAPVTIVEFADFQCPFCQQSVAVLDQVMKKYGKKVRFIFRDFPVASLHPDAYNAAKAGVCAAAQDKFWEMHDTLYANQSVLGQASLVAYANGLRLDLDAFQNCMASAATEAEVQADLTDGVKAGVVGTPTWFVNGWRIEGALSYDAWKKIIDYGVKGKL